MAGAIQAVADKTVIAALKPIQEKYQAVMDDKGYLESVLRDGREKAEATPTTPLVK